MLESVYYSRCSQSIEEADVACFGQVSVSLVQSTMAPSWSALSRWSVGPSRWRFLVIPLADASALRVLRVGVAAKPRQGRPRVDYLFWQFDKVRVNR